MERDYLDEYRGLIFNQNDMKKHKKVYIYPGLALFLPPEMRTWNQQPLQSSYEWLQTPLPCHEVDVRYRPLRPQYPFEL